MNMFKKNKTIKIIKTTKKGGKNGNFNDFRIPHDNMPFGIVS